MAFLPNQLSVLNNNYDRNPFPSDLESERIAQEIDLSLAQVKSWFQRQRFKRKVTQLEDGNDNSVGSTTSSSFVIAPKLDSIKSINSLNNQENLKQSSDQFNLDVELVKLLGNDLSLKNPDHILPFCKIMNKTVSISDIIKNLTILSAAGAEALQAFVVSKGMAILYNWRLKVDKDQTNIKIYLKTLSALPFNIKAFKEYPIAKYLSKKWAADDMPFGKANTNIDIRNNVLSLLDKWMKIATSSQTVKRTGLETRIEPKRVKVDQLTAVGSSNLFKKLNENSLPKADTANIISSKKYTDDTPSSSTNLSYKSASSPTREYNLTTFKPGKSKKSVRFKGPGQLESVKMFNLDDAPEVISGKINPTVSAEAEIELGAHTFWVPPKTILLAPEVQPPIVNSAEAKIQEDRERNVVSVYYMSPKDIPPSPAEPSDPTPDPIQPPLKWLLNTKLKELPSAINDISYLPLLSALFTQQPVQWVQPSQAIPYQIPSTAAFGQPVLSNLAIGNFGNPNLPNFQPYQPINQNNANYFQQHAPQNGWAGNNHK